MAVPLWPQAGVQTLTLDACLKQALGNGHKRPASAFSLQVAQAQHSQALAGYWPQVDLQAGFQRRDHAPDFLFPASSFTVPGMAIPVPGLGTLQTPAQAMQIPAQNVKLMGPSTTSASLNAAWLLWDGGMRRGQEGQAQGGVDAAAAEVRRTDLEIQDSVTRMYYAAILARQLREVGRDALLRLEGTLKLTETMYLEGSGRVRKTDYLQAKVMVATVRAAMATLEKNEILTQAALANVLGLGWEAAVSPASREIPYEPFAVDLDKAVGSSFQFNVDWQKLEAGLRALEAGEATARSGAMPRLALTVDLHRFWNDYDAGLATRNNKEGWTVGIGVKVPVFNGGLVRSQVREARARLDRTREERFLLKEGIGLMVRDNLLGMQAARGTVEATGEAMRAARENRELTARAYQNELMETQDVIKAELIESLMTAQHLRSRFDHAALQSQLTLIVGNEVWKQLRIGN